MPATARPHQIRPNTAPAHYLGRPASIWLTAATKTTAVPQGRR